MRELAVGYSPCPNDTFMFCGLVHGDVAVADVRFTPVLADIEELNRRALGPERLPMTKLSVPALAAVCDHYAVLPSGAALGHGCGPLVVCRVAARARTLGDLTHGRVAIPGELTTARLLFRLFARPELELVVMRFDRILAAVVAGTVDAGVIIHESRFTFEDHGLRALADLGVLWDADSGGLPLPLGLIAVERTLPRELFESLGDGLRASVELARREPSRSRDYVRAHAQELSESVCAEHIALYVNDYSIDLGATGRSAVEALLERGRARGLLAAGPAPWVTS